MIRSKISKLISFGPGVCATSVLHSACVRLPFASSAAKYWNERRHEAVIRYLMACCGDVIERHRNDEVAPLAPAAWVPRVWTMWWQGEEAMPEEARICVASMREHSSGCEVVVVSKENIDKFIELPAHIKTKLGDGITYAHLSDIVRAMLLAEHGGLWIDACVLCDRDIPRWVFDRPYFTVRPGERDISCISRARWVGGVTGGVPCNVYASFLSDFLIEYWRHEDVLIDYFLIDYATEIAYREIPSYRAALDSLPLNSEGLFLLNEIANRPLGGGCSLEEALSNGPFFCLSHKLDHMVENEGEQTVYGAIKKRYLKGA